MSEADELRRDLAEVMRQRNEARAALREMTAERDRLRDSCAEFSKALTDQIRYSDTLVTMLTPEARAKLMEGLGPAWGLAAIRRT